MVDFPPRLSHGALEEVLPGIYRVSGLIQPPFPGGGINITRSMTVIRDGDALSLVSTIRLDEPGLVQLESLGKVTNVVTLGSFHGRDDPFYVDRYGANVWAFPGTPHNAGVSTTHELGEGTAGPCADASSFEIPCQGAPEGVLLLERHGGVLLSFDSLHNMVEPDAYFDAPSAERFGAAGFFGKANIGVGWLRTAKPPRAGFDHILALEFKHLLSAHGTPLLDEAKPAVRATVERVFSGADEAPA